MKELKRRVEKVEREIYPHGQPIIFADSREEAGRLVRKAYEENPNAQPPVVYLAGQIFKPEGSGTGGKPLSPAIQELVDRVVGAHKRGERAES